MAGNPITGFDVALRHQVSKDWTDCVSRKRNIIQIFKGLDTYYNEEGTRIQRENNIAGPTLQVDFQTGYPSVVGVDVRGAGIPADLADAENTSWVSGLQGISGYQFGETIRKSYLRNFQNSPPALAAKFVKKISDSIMKAVWRRIDDDMFGGDAYSTVAAAAQGTFPNWSRTSIMRLNYPLQNPGSSYLYLDIDLNAAAYADLRAVVWSPGSATAPTLRNLRTNLIFPLIDREGDPDLGICAYSVLDYMISVAEGKYAIAQAEKLVLGGEAIQYAGIWWVPTGKLGPSPLQTPRTSGTYDNELYILQSDTWLWSAMDLGDIEVVSVPRGPTKKFAQGHFEAALTCKAPRFNARMTNVSAP